MGTGRGPTRGGEAVPCPESHASGGRWAWDHRTEPRDRPGPSQRNDPPTSLKGVWRPRPGAQPEPPAGPAEGPTPRVGRCRAWRSLAGLVPVCLPVLGRHGPPPPLFSFTWQGAGPGRQPACSGHLLPLRRGWGQRGARPGSGAGGAGGQPASRRGGKLPKQPKSRVWAEGTQPGGKAGRAEEATKKIKKVFQGNKTKGDGETGGKGERE